MVSAASKPIVPIALVLVAGSNYQAREAWIAAAIAALPSNEKTGVLLEGLPTGILLLQSQDQLIIERIAPGCLCCIGQLAMRVTLNRLLRQNLKNLYIAINDTQHLAQLQQAFLLSPYDQILQREKVMVL
jgi:hypothetical protein